MDRQIRWGRIVIAAVLLEVAITAAVAPFGLIYGNPVNVTPGHSINPTPYLAAAAIGCAVFGFLFGFWAARGASSRLALHGLLTGIVATLLYFGLCSLVPGGIPAVIAGYSLTMYVTFNVLRISGCWLGGVYAASRRNA